MLTRIDMYACVDAYRHVSMSTCAHVYMCPCVHVRMCACVSVIPARRASLVNQRVYGILDGNQVLEY